MIRVVLVCVNYMYYLFLTLEDETGMANIIVPPDAFTAGVVRGLRLTSRPHDRVFARVACLDHGDSIDHLDVNAGRVPKGARPADGRLAE